MQTPLHIFDNGVKVYQSQLRKLQLDRYSIVNIHEPVEETHFVRIVEESTDHPFVFIDIGAAIGYYTILLKLLRPDAIVEIFEPLELHRQYMIENFSINEIDISTINIHEAAVSNRVGTATFIQNRYGSSLAGKSLHTGVRGLIKSILQRRKLKRAKIPITTLDSLTSELSLPISMAKVDVQGFEIEVLQGATNLMHSKLVISWIISTHSVAIHNLVRAMLQKYDYQILVDESEVENQPDGLIIAQL